MVQYDVDALREAAAMTAIVRILGMLDQPAARERVIRWAAEKIQIGSVSVLGPIASTPPREPERDEPADGVNPPAAAEQAHGKEPIDALVRELAADLQRLALASNGA